LAYLWLEAFTGGAKLLTLPLSEGAWPQQLPCGVSKVSGRVLRGKTDEIVAGYFEVSQEDELPTVGEEA
jgi:hypothetical protein